MTRSVRELLETRDRLLKRLGDQQLLRNHYPDLGWIAAERDAMLNGVNLERLDRGLPSVTVDAIARVESWACGHVDYSSKFALYCAEIALGQREGQS